MAATKTASCQAVVEARKVTSTHLSFHRAMMSAAKEPGMPNNIKRETVPATTKKSSGK